MPLNTLRTFRNGEDNASDDSSPLLFSNRRSSELHRDSHPPDDDHAQRSTGYLFLLTLGFCGLQVVWSVEFSYGSPYLISLGLSKSLLAFVWLAGPLSGTFVQPYIGAMSDNCRVRWGRRKPFILGGAAGTIAVLFILAWSRDIVGGLLHTVFGVPHDSAVVKNSTIVVATVSMYGLDVALNTVQATLRALIADKAPENQQQPANAWASGMMGAGTILGYVFGYLNLPKYLPFLGDSQFKVLCVISSLSLALALLFSCSFITERNPNLDGPATARSEGGFGLVAFFRHVISSIRSLPPQIRGVCMVQIAAWIGWFPFLFYATTYIGQLYVNPIFTKHPNLKDSDITKVWEDATRIGAFALVINSIISFATNVLLPVFVDQPSGDNTPSSSTAAPALAFDLSRLRVPGLTLRRAWLTSHILFALSMFSTFFIGSTTGGTIFVAVVGICWALTLWAPFALISSVIAATNSRASNSGYDQGEQWERTPSRSTTPSSCQSSTSGDETQSEPDSDGSVITAIYAPRPAPIVSPSSSVTTIIPYHQHDPESVIPDRTPNSPGPNDEYAPAGIILGIHNVAISSPQFLATLISSVIFSLSQKPRGVPGDKSVAWVLRFGGLSALAAAWLTWKYVRESDGGGGNRGRRNARV